jgi:signal transduction histidine kinase/ligand-binding sensor domain-containing protein/DNA-binding response OmpR family regulator
MAFRLSIHALLPLVWLLASCWCSAQSVRFETIDSDEGLSQGMVYDILQDKLGYLWFGTRDGLNRYDGYRFQVYKNDPFNEFSVSDNIIRVLLEDRYGRIWVGTENNGVDVFDQASGKFFHLSKGAGGLSSQKTLSLAETSDGAIWVGTEFGLNRILLPEALPAHVSDLSAVAAVEQFFWEEAVPETASPFRSDYFISLAEADDGLLWAGTMLNCFNYDFKAKKLNKVSPDKQARPRTNYVAKAPDGSIWVGQFDRIIHYSGSQTFVYPLPALQNSTFISLAFDREGNLFVNRRKEIYFLPTAEKKGGEIVPQLFYRFPEKDVIGSSKIFCDRRGLIWIGTNGYGIRKYNPAKSLFKHFLRGVSTRKIRINAKGECWVWTSTGVFSLLDQAGGQSKRQLDEGNDLFYHDCLFGRDGNLWLLAQNKTGATDNSLVIQKNLSTGKTKQMINLVAAGLYSQLLEDRLGNIWILGDKSELVHYNVSNGTAQKYDLSAFTGFKEYAFALLEDENGHIWVGTPHGLIRGIPENNNELVNWRLYKNNPSDKNSLNNNAILCLLDDARSPHRFLWVGTKGGGLNLLDKETGNCRHFTPADGLPNDVVYGILQDDQGCLWLSTNSGLSKFNVNTNFFENYSAADGLQDNEFNTTSYTKAPNGTMYFGGVNGLSIFDPSLIKTEGPPPPVQITAIKVNGKPLPPGQSWSPGTSGQESTITLPYNQNHITIDFSAMDFSTPQKNQYRYRMIGTLNEWSEATNEHSTTFSNLSPGKYVFEVRTGGAHGIWTGDTERLNITILAPWWKSRLAFLAYGLLLVCLGWTVYRFQVRRIQIQEQLAFEQREAERIKAVEQMKTNLFNNLTHELRTPITLILEPLRQILQKPSTKNWLHNIRIAEANSQKLLLIVNQLLDLAKLEGGGMQAENHLWQAAVILETTANTFAVHAQSKHISFVFDPDDVFVPPFKFDADKLGKIASNLLSNAMKFTPQGGKVEMSWKVAQDNWFVLKVFNSGQGISATDMPKIFDRYFSRGENKEPELASTGIGLALCRELAELMSGRIEAESEEGAGTTFRLWLPMVGMSAPANVADANVLGIKPVEATTETTSQVAETNESRERPLLLLAEDNRELRHFISKTLQEKYEVLEAVDGQEAVGMALERVPDIVVSDLMMPRLDGLGLLKALKNDVRTSHIPFLMLTAKTELESRLTGIELGADAYLGKPFQTEELYAWLSNLLENRRRLQETYKYQGAGQGAIAMPSDQPSAGPSALKSELGLLDRQFLTQFKEIVEAEIDNDRITPAEIAHRLNMSRSQLHRKLTALTGSAVSEYLRNYRLERAMELLRNGAGNVSEVAWKVGFINPKHFSTAFKEKFGKSPSEV